MGLLNWLGLRRSNPWERPTTLDELLDSPLRALIRRIFALILLLRGTPSRPPRGRRPIRVVCISDTHDGKPAVPDGDLLIHAGDLTDDGSAAAIQHQVDWLDSLPHRHKVLVCGNHDSWFDPASRPAADCKPDAAPDLKSVRYLQDESAVLEFEGGRRLNVYGAGDVPQCGGSSFAFQYARGKDPWTQRIPIETDILVTHTPPSHHLDLGLGCAGLLQEVWRVKPKLHVFGHVHWGRGREAAHYDECQRAYEDVMARPAWRSALRVVQHGAAAVLWKWLMLGPGPNNAGLMVNAAQMYGNTHMLRSDVQVVDL